jgi:hypothetical protein
VSSLSDDDEAARSSWCNMYLATWSRTRSSKVQRILYTAAVKRQTSYVTWIKLYG